jgi:glutamine amidotransferase
MLVAAGECAPGVYFDAMRRMSTGTVAAHEYAGRVRHADGWGVTCMLPASTDVAVYRSSSPIATAELLPAIGDLSCRMLAIHARNASVPAQKGLGFVQPIERFIGGERTWFFHNGFVPSVHRLLGLARSQWDSLELLDWLAPAFDHSDWRRALAVRLQALPADSTAANCIFLSARRAIVCNWFNRSNGATAYYTMHCWKGERAVGVASEPFPEMAEPVEWNALGHGRVAECRVGDDGRPELDITDIN